MLPAGVPWLPGAFDGSSWSNASGIEASLAFVVDCLLTANAVPLRSVSGASILAISGQRGSGAYSESNTLRLTSLNVMISGSVAGILGTAMG